MKRIGLAAIVFCLLAGLQAMAQATSTTTSTAAAKPAANSTAKPAANSAPKHVIYLEGTGTVQRTGGDASAKADAGSKWPSPTYVDSSEEHAKGESASSGSQGELRCLGPERRPCEESNVRELSRRLEEKGAEHPALADIRTLRLESSDGSLLCEQANGGHCTSEQVRALNEHVAQPLRCEIYFHQSSSSQNQTSTAQSSTGTTPSTASGVASSASHTPANSSTTGNASSATSTATSSTAGSSTTTPGKTQSKSLTAQNHAAAAQHHPVPPHPPQPEHKQQ